MYHVTVHFRQEPDFIYTDIKKGKEPSLGSFPSCLDKESILSVLDIVAFLEPFHPSRGIDKFLLAGEEGVTVGAYFYLEVLDRGPCFNDITACAGDCRGFIFWMNITSHVYPPVSKDQYTMFLQIRPVPLTVSGTGSVHRFEEDLIAL